MNEKIVKIFKELDIEGDIAPLESDTDFWKRKLVEVYNATNPEDYCTQCGGRIEFLTEEEDDSIQSRLFWCARCKIGFNIQTGPQVDEWATDPAIIDFIAPK